MLLDRSCYLVLYIHRHVSHAYLLVLKQRADISLTLSRLTLPPFQPLSQVDRSVRMISSSPPYLVMP